MVPNNPSQELWHELNDLSLSLEQATVEILELTRSCRDAEVVATLRLIAKLYEDADRLAALADEVEAGQVVRVDRPYT